MNWRRLFTSKAAFWCTTSMVCLVFSYFVVKSHADRHIHSFTYFLPWFLALVLFGGYWKKRARQQETELLARDRKESILGRSWFTVSLLACAILATCYLFWHIVFLNKSGKQLIMFSLIFASGMWVAYVANLSYCNVHTRSRK